jgi:hypothetical protein
MCNVFHWGFYEKIPGNSAGYKVYAGIAAAQIIYDIRD